MPLPVAALARAAAVAGGEGASGAYPGPGPWDARAWVGAVLYVLLFLGALAGILALLRGAPPQDAPPPESGA